MRLIDAREINENILAKVGEFYQTNKGKVVIINASDDEASEVYCDKKQQAFEKVGVECLVYDLDEYTTTSDMIEEIQKLNEDETVTGIMVQHPVYKDINFRDCMMAIDPLKDIDGLHPMNQGINNYGISTIKPATAEGVEMLLESIDYDVEGKTVVILGRGFLVADVLAKSLENKNATVVKLHTRTQWSDKERFLERADVLISCVGQDLQHELNPNKCPNCEVLIGVGFRYENGKQMQDFRIEDWENEINTVVTSRIGGTGLATISALLVNSVLACMLQQSNILGGTK